MVAEPCQPLPVISVSAVAASGMWLMKDVAIAPESSSAAPVAAAAPNLRRITPLRNFPPIRLSILRQLASRVQRAQASRAGRNPDVLALTQSYPSEVASFACLIN
jgi:hypothetical protein